MPVTVLILTKMYTVGNIIIPILKMKKLRSRTFTLNDNGKWKGLKKGKSRDLQTGVWSLQRPW